MFSRDRGVRKWAGSCSILLDQTDCDQAVPSTWLGHSAPVRPNKRRRALSCANSLLPLVATPRGHFFISSRDPERRPDSILSANVLARLLNFIFLALLLPIRRPGYNRMESVRSDSLSINPGNVEDTFSSSRSETEIITRTNW